jgi:antitoxin VapB
MASLNLKDAEAHALAAELARRTGRSLTDAVKESLRESLRREEAQCPETARLVGRVMRIAERAASRPVLDARTADEILGYDEAGAPGR